MNLGLLVNRVAAPWSPTEPDSWGGGEEAIVQWSRAMVRAGHSVTVLWPGPAGDDHGVQYVTEGTRVGPFDVLVCRKRPDGPRLGLAPVHVLWGEGGLVVERPADFVACVVPTRFCERGYATRVPALRTVVIPLGYDPATDLAPLDTVRDPGLVLHTASPDRGLVHLLQAWPAVLEAHPTARLEIAYGWDLYDACGGPPGVKAEVNLYVDRLPNIHMARRPRADLTRLYGQAGVWAYYCTGGEDFCLSAIKSAINGAVPVVKPWGALHETVRPPVAFSEPDTFAADLIRALDPVTQDAARQAMDVSHCRTWSEVAAAWAEMLATCHETTAESCLVQVPSTPADLVPDGPGQASRVLPGLVREWMARAGVQRLWCDQNSGLMAAPLPDGVLPDGIVVGWGLEDSALSPAAVFDDLGVHPGMAVLVLSSLGPWRAAQRYRVFDRETIAAVFGQQPDLHTSVTPLLEDGSAVCVTAFRYDPAKLGTAGPAARVARVNPAGSVSACLIAPRSMPRHTLTRCLASIECIADEVLVAVNGPETPGEPLTADLVTAWASKSGIEARIIEATSPRYCFDCYAIHPLGDEAHGHRYAGFETPRNQSITGARGDWILWLDDDEELLHGERLRKYLRPNMFRGYALPQDHFSSDPPNATRRDNPMRLFRREPLGDPGWIGEEPGGWPTWHPGLTMRFAGIVHEHPGELPNHLAGANPVMLLPDVWLAHGGYYTEQERRGRFVRNWPLMMADRQKYPDRELGAFLWMRDLTQHLRYATQHTGGALSREMVSQAREVLRLYRTLFLDNPTPYSAEAAMYAGACATMLGEGFDVQIRITGQCAEVSGGEQSVVEFSARVRDADEIVRLIKPRLGPLERWAGDYR